MEKNRRNFLSNFATLTLATGAATGTSALMTNNSSVTSENKATQNNNTDEIISVKDFGAVGDGVTDDTVAIQNALKAFNDIGGKIIVPNGMRCVVGDLWVSKGVTFEGSNAQPGWDENLEKQYKNYGSALLLKENSTIHLQAGSTLRNLLIVPNGMLFPQLNPDSWKGTAVKTQGDDAHIEYCLIMGFNQAIEALGHKRPRIKNIYFDCINGIHVGDCWDIGVVQDCHAWSFATVANLGKTGYTDLRPGIAYLFGKGGDLRAIDNFSYGYYRGTVIDSCNGITILNMGNDTNPKNHPHSIGMIVQGSSESVRLIDCQTAAYDDAGVIIDITNDTPVFIQNHNCWGYMKHGILVKKGNIIVASSGYSTMQNGITSGNDKSVISIDNCNFDNIWGTVFNADKPGALWKFGKNTFSRIKGEISTGITLKTIDSANNLVIDHNWSEFTVNGSVPINTIMTPYAGRIIRIIFNNEIDILSGIGRQGGIRLNNNAIFHAISGSTLTLIGKDTKNWHEISRSY